MLLPWQLHPVSHHHSLYLCQLSCSSSFIVIVLILSFMISRILRLFWLLLLLLLSLYISISIICVTFWVSSFLVLSIFHLLETVFSSLVSVMVSELLWPSLFELSLTWEPSGVSNLGVSRVVTFCSPSSSFLSTFVLFVDFLHLLLPLPVLFSPGCPTFPDHF